MPGLRLAKPKAKSEHKCIENIKYCSDCEWVYCSICGRILGEFSSLHEVRTHEQIHEDFGFEPPKAMMNEMDLIFKLAKEKAIEKSSEKGNTATPWKDFTPGWLKYRLVKEFKEWDETRDINELLDVINLAAFVYLAKKDSKPENMRDFVGGSPAECDDAIKRGAV